MGLQCFAASHNWTITGELDVEKDQFAHYYADGVRVTLARPEGAFTALLCADGQTRYVMTSDWAEVQHLAGAVRSVAL